MPRKFKGLPQALLLLSLCGPAAAPCQTRRPSSLLQSMRGLARPILLFAGDHDPQALAQYIQLTRHRDQMQLRQVAIVLVTSTPMPATPPPPAGSVAATEPERAALRSQFGIQPGAFAILLLGKDGGEKFRSTHPVPFDRLAALIDTMPMRQQEMRSHRH